MNSITGSELDRLIVEHVVRSSDFRARHHGYSPENIGEVTLQILNGMRALGFIRHLPATATTPESAYRGKFLAQVPQGSLNSSLLAQDFALQLAQESLSTLYPTAPVGHYWIASEVALMVTDLVRETDNFVHVTDDCMAYWGIDLSDPDGNPTW